MKKILISTSSFGKDDRAPLDLLDKEGIAYELNPYGRKLSIAESKELMKDMDGVIAGTEALNDEVFAACGGLKVVSRCGTGMDAVDLDAAGQRGIRVYNTPTVHVDAVAELAIAGILSLARNLPITDAAMKNKEWSKSNGRNITGKTVAVLGFGKVGRKVANVFSAMGAKVLAYDLYMDAASITDSNIKVVSNLDEIWKDADIISLHMPFSASAKHLVNSDVFAMLKKDVIIANTARGGLIDEQALYNFLSANKRAGAFLDVFEEEPYSGNLCDLKNTLLTPHVGTSTAETRVNMELESVTNLVNHFKQ